MPFKKVTRDQRLRHIHATSKTIGKYTMLQSGKEFVLKTSLTSWWSNTVAAGGLSQIWWSGDMSDDVSKAFKLE